MKLKGSSMDEVLSLLGLAYKAKKIVLGEEIFNRINNVKLVFIASDISPKSLERYDKKCYYYNITHIDKYDSEELSKALGKNNVKTIGIIDEGFKNSILKKIEKEGYHG